MTIKSSDITGIDLQPVCRTKYTESVSARANIGQFEHSSNEFRKLALNAYKKWGFIRLQTKNVCQPKEKIKEIAREFGFNSAFVPPQYSEDTGLHNEFGINEISHENEDMGNHEGFQSNEEQAVHVDGTLEPIGTVPTTLMLCHSQAESGGESRIFNSVAAFCRLASEHPKLANALCSNQALTRSDVDRSGRSITGPAFDINHYGLVTRFSLDNTSKWNVDEVENLQQALEWMKDELTPNGEFYAEFQLTPGDFLIIANHKISHGRNKYNDTKDNRRRLYRAIFDNEIG